MECEQVAEDFNFCRHSKALFTHNVIFAWCKNWCEKRWIRNTISKVTDRIQIKVLTTLLVFVSLISGLGGQNFKI